MKTATACINGAVTPHSKGVKFDIRVNGATSTRTYRSGSPHQAAYTSAIRSMTEADADGVTHLMLQTPANLVRLQAIEEWKCVSAPLVALKDDYKRLKQAFDSVEWVAGPA